MELKVRALDEVEAKSVQEIEEQLLEQHEENLNQEDQAVEETAPEAQEESYEQEKELSEEDVLSYIAKRYNKPISSFDELLADKQESEPLPEDVAAYLKYKKDTGRGFDDFLKLNKDYDAMDPEDLLHDYFAATNEALDEEDIETLLDDYRYDEDYDDESTIKKVKIARKKAIAEAKKFFNTQKEQYRVPLESRQGLVPEEEKEMYESYRQYISEAKTIEEENQRKRQWFDQKTDEVFNGEFKGFEFNINDRSMVFSPGDAQELKKLQSNPSNFITRFLDENGLMKDAKGYHRSLALAMNPDKFAKFFYEQGMADATDSTLKNIKNIDMSERKANESGASNTGGFQVKAVNPDSGRKLKIRSIKKV